MTTCEIIKRPWLLCEEEVGCVLVDLGVLGRPDLLQVDVNSCLINEEVEAVARYVVDLHNASLVSLSDPWIDLASLGRPQFGVWPWDGGLVLIHCRSTIPREPGETGAARYWWAKPDRPTSDWWWAGDCPDFGAAPISQTNDPVTHVRRIVPPVEI